jgi:hypothetical protein
LQLVDKAAEQHRLAFTGIAFYPQQSAVRVLLPLLESGVIEDPAIGVCKQSAFSLFDTLFVVARIRVVYVSNAYLELVDLIL